MNEPQWYTDRKSFLYGNASLTDYYAPLPVFFEGWSSGPRESIVSYEWDFGDGSPGFSGFNAAHVYETPGTYTVTLTVTHTSDATATTSIPVVVRERDGNTYYVDAASGSDAADGSEATPWQTATHAFNGLDSGRYHPGDQILFKRGQTFDMETGTVVTPHWNPCYGLLFGTYGTGEKPIIKAVGAGGGDVILLQGVGGTHLAFVDLSFDCTPEGGDTAASLISAPGGGMNILFLRVDAKDFLNGWGINATKTGNIFSGLFVKDCTSYNAESVHVFTTAWRVALLNNTFDFSNNHVAYLSTLNIGVIDGNTFSKPAFGRTAMRISGGPPGVCPASNIWVSNNEYLGWIDPETEGSAHNGGGVRYNYLLVNLGPNVPDAQDIDWIVFENNLITNAETMLNMADIHHFIGRNNTFITPDNSTSNKIEFGSSVAWDYRPLNDVQFVDNTIRCNGTDPFYSHVFALHPYTRQAEYPDQEYHQGVVIERNIVEFTGANMRLWRMTAH